MKSKSLQQIEDYYINLGYNEYKLRKVLDGDKEYQRLIQERKYKLVKKFKISSLENKKYILSTDEDYEILGRVKKLEKLNLNSEHRSLVKFIKTQLEIDWRKSLLYTLNQLLKKYS